MTRSLAFLLLLLPVLIGCDSDPAGTNTSHVGVYQLQTVNGDQVPVSFEEDGEIFTVLEASLTLSANNTFAVVFDFEITADGETTAVTDDSLSGTYTRTANTITFAHGGEDEGFESATLSGDLLTTSGGDGEVLVFEK